MNERRASLRLRLFAGVLGAGLLAMALLAIVLLLEVRDALYARHLAAARERLHAGAVAAAELCQQRDAMVVRNCLAEVSAVLALSGIAQPFEEGPCVPLLRQGDQVILCEEVAGTGAPLRLLVPLGTVRAELASLDARLLLALAGALGVMVLLSVWLLERGVVRRLSSVDAALDLIGASGEGELLPESGDALGRLGASVNRLGERLREERARTREQIVSLQQANRLLAEEKRALRETREDLARSERLASVGRLAAGVAHEVGNPVAAVIAWAALLREKVDRGAGEGAADGSGAPAVADYVERIEREAARIDRILRDLLDLARPGPQRLEPVDLGRAAAEASALLEPQPFWSGVALETALPPGLPPAAGERHYLVQVLVNLLTNAAKAGARKVRLAGRAEGDAVLLEVADDGRGIPAEHLDRLFEPFFTTAAPGQGTGLGLALCHATMERFGGSIAARSGEAGGAVFTLRFRALPEPPAAAPAPPSGA